MLRVLLLMAVASLVAGCAKPPATNPGGPTYHCHSTAKPPTIDGKIDDDAWKDVAWTDDFIDVTDGSKAPLRTRAKMIWDAENLYIAAELEEPDVWDKLTEHDDRLFNENAFEVFIDPDHDGLNYAELEINALGTTLDLVMDKAYRSGGHLDLDWTCEGWKTAVNIDGTINDEGDRDRGWTVEMAIPWSALKKLAPDVVPPRDAVLWRMELARVESGRGETTQHWVWSPTGAANFHVPDRWGWVEFVK
jgi:hypothetical protein